MRTADLFLGGFMRRFVSWVGVFGVLWVTAIGVAAQAKPTLEQLDRVMKKDGPAQQALVKAIVAGNQTAAKENLETLQKGIAEAQTFWVANKRTDAIEFSKTVLKKLDGIDTLLSAPKMDSNATLAAVQDLNKSCTECHKAYRTTDDDGRYILKPGSVPGY
jgi:cytochrome c556